MLFYVLGLDKTEPMRLWSEKVGGTPAVKSFSIVRESCENGANKKTNNTHPDTSSWWKEEWGWNTNERKIEDHAQSVRYSSQPWVTRNLRNREQRQPRVTFRLPSPQDTESRASLIVVLDSNEKRDPEIAEMSFSFSCGGWLQFYLFGVAQCLRDHGFHNSGRIAGSSAGLFIDVRETFLFGGF